MKNLLRVFVTFCVVSIALVACSEDNATNPVEKIDFNIDLGKSVVFDVFPVNSAGIKIPYKIMTDSMVCDKVETLDGKKAYFYYMTDYEGIKYYPDVYAYDNKVLYIHNSFIDYTLLDLYFETNYLFPFKPAEKWLPFVDYTRKSWVISDENINNFDMMWNNMPDYVVANGNLKITGEQLEDEKIPYKSDSIVCNRFQVNLVFNGNMTEKLNNNETIDLKTNIKIIQYIIPGIGKVRTIYIPSKITMGTERTESFGGYGTFTILK